MKPRSAVIVVLGIASDGKPHAAWFEISEEALARKAASLMGFRVGKVDGEKAAATIKGLAQGKVFASGRALVPYSKMEAYEKLAAAIEFEDGQGPSSSSSQTGADPVESEKVGSLADIKVGSVILSGDTKTTNGWYEAVVVAVSRDNETLTLRWRDWPKDKPFSRDRRSVALIP